MHEKEPFNNRGSVHATRAHQVREGIGVHLPEPQRDPLLDPLLGALLGALLEPLLGPMVEPLFGRATSCKARLLAEMLGSWPGLTAKNVGHASSYPHILTLTDATPPCCLQVEALKDASHIAYRVSCAISHLAMGFQGSESGCGAVARAGLAEGGHVGRCRLQLEGRAANAPGLPP